MTFQEHLSYIDELRKFSEHSRGNVKYSWVHRADNGKARRTRLATLMLYPVFDDSHYCAMKKLEELHISYSGISHDNDYLDNDSDILVQDTSNGVGEQFTVPHSIIEDEDSPDFNPDNLPSAFDSDKKRIHDHIVIRTEDGHTNTAIAKWLGINSVYVRMWPDNYLNNRLRYQTHLDNPDKTQYNPSNMYGCLSVRYAQVAREYCKKPTELLSDILVQIKRTNKTKYIHSTDFFIKMIRDGYDSCLKSFRPIIRDAIIEHNMYANFLKQEGIREFDLNDRNDLDYNPDSYIGHLDINK